MNHITRILAASFILLSLHSAVSAELDEVRRVELARQFAEHHALPRYRELSTATRDLGERLRAFCARTDASALENTRDGFRSAYLKWMAVQHIRFGPVMRDDVYYKLQFWPDKHRRGARQLSALLQSNDPTPGPDALGGLSVAVQGFPALERLLFDVGVPGFTSANGPKRCALAASIAEHLGALTQALVTKWRSYTPGDSDDVLQNAYHGYAEQFSAITQLKIERPMGAAPDAARPKRCEAWRSGISFTAIAENLDALGAVFDGENGWPGFRAVLRSDDETNALADSISEHLRYGANVVRNRSHTLAEAVTLPDERKFLDFLLLHVEQTMAMSAEIVPEELGVSTGFNSLDGD